MRAIRAMIPILAGAAIVTASALASAQPGPPPPPMPRAAPPPGYSNPPPPPMPYQQRAFERRGFTYGLAFGVGGMNSKAGTINCADCEGEPLSGSFSFHLGAMVSPKFALMFEFSGTAKQLDSTSVTMLTQSFAMIAARYWVTPKLWLGGGLGFAHVSLSYDDGWVAQDEPIADGGAMMGSLGYELLSGPRFAIDLQVRLGVGTYDGLGTDNQIQTGTIGVGFSGF